MEAKLVVVGGKANKAEVKLKLPTVIGRGRDADLTVAHGTVSRHHCLIYELDGALVVRDNGSLNGTLIGGERIKEALLRPGDTLTVGPLTFRADYEHEGAFPSLGEQPTVPNFQDTVGDGSRRNGAAVSEPPTLPSEEGGQFDFLNKAAAPAAEEGALELPNFGDKAAATEDASAAIEDSHEAADAHEEPDVTSDGPTLDFLAGGSDVVPVDDENEAPSFGFLNSGPAESAAAVEESPAADLPLEAEESKDEEAPSFGFLNQSAPAAAPAEETPSSFNFTEPADQAEPAADEAPATEAADSFQFNPAASESDEQREEPAAPAAGDDPPPGVSVPDAELAADASDDEAPSFGFLNQSAPAAASAEETPSAFNFAAAEQAEAAAEEAPKAEVAESFDFLNATNEPAPAEEAAPASEPALQFDASEPLAAADELDESTNNVQENIVQENNIVQEDVPGFAAQASDEEAPSFGFLNQPSTDARAVDEANAADEFSAAALDSTAEEFVPPAEEPHAAEAEAANEEMPQFDFGAGDSAPRAADKREPAVESDEAPQFGYLGSLAPTGDANEAESSLPEMTLHDPEESESDAARLADAPEIGPGDESSLKFEDEPQATADSSAGFSFLGSDVEPAANESANFKFVELNDSNTPPAAHGEPELNEFAISEDEPTSSESRSSAVESSADEDFAPLADDDSGEFALPLETPAAEAAEAGFGFLNADATDEGASDEAEAADEDPGEYSISLEPPVAAPPRRIPPLESEASAGEEEPSLELEPTAATAEELSAEELAAEPAAEAESAATKKRGWWPFGKAKGAEPAKAKEKGKGKAVDKPVAPSQAAAPAPAPQFNLNAPPAADAEEAALGFLSDTPSPAASDSTLDLPAGNDSGIKIETGEPSKKKRGAAAGDDELNNFFESIGLD